MSTALHDVRSAAFVAAGLHPDTIDDSATGPAIDMIAADGPCFAIQQVGAFSEDTILSGSIEQSPDGTSWEPIAGAEFADVMAANNVQVIRFTRTARYVRYAAALVAAAPEVTLAVVIGEQQKTM
jgi:hypothetical protein